MNLSEIYCNFQNGCHFEVRGVFKQEVAPEVESYNKTSSISGSLVSKKLAYDSDVVRASPVGAAPITSSFMT